MVQMLDDGRIIMHGGGKYYTINRDGSGKHVFSGNVINTTSSYVVGNGVNRIYYSSYAGKEESIYPGGAQPVELTWTDEDGIHTSRTGIPLSDGCKFYNICYVDIDTGEVQTVVEKTGIDFILTDDYLYYRGFDYHMLEGEHACGPEKEWGDLKVPRAIGHNGELWRLDLKTGEKTLVSDNFGFYGYGDGVLIGDYLFQWFDCVYDFKTNSFHYDDHLKWVFYDMVNNTYEVPPELQGRWG